MVDKLWFYEADDRFMSIPYTEEGVGKITFDDNSIINYFWQTTDDSSAETKVKRGCKSCWHTGR